MTSFEYPKILNLIWDSSKLTFLNYLTILSFKKYHKDWKIHIYYTSAQSNSGEANWKTPEQKLKLNDDVEDYWDRLKEDRSLNLICVDEFIRSLNLSHLNIVQQSDILRIYILYTYGGVYSDFDIIYIRNIEPYFIPHQHSNILFFGIEPNGYIYFPVGFFITMPRQESYKKILQLQLLESNNPGATGDYQYFGAAMLKRLRTHPNSILGSFKLLPAKCYLPIFWFEIDKKLYNGNLTNLGVDEESFGIHWFNGSSSAKSYINNFRLSNPVICTMDTLVSNYVGDLKKSSYTPPLPPISEIEEDTQLNAPKEVKISIVMSYINRSTQLKHTLHTIRKSSYKNIEVVVVDDGSIPEHRLEQFIMDFDMEVVLIRIEPQDKKWINPCVPYNIALDKATGDIIIIQNPEVCHVGDIITYCKENASDDKYITFSVISSLNEAENHKIYNYQGEELDIVNAFAAHSWYNHPIHRNSQFHFLSCMTRKTLEKVGGFNEDFKNGLSYDDDEFVGRLRKVTNCITLPPEKYFGIHLWHPGGSAFYDKKVDLLETLININSQLHKKLMGSTAVHRERGKWEGTYTHINNKNVIIFGSTGMLGRYLVKFLKEKGYQVTVINRTHCDAERVVDIKDIENIIGCHMKKNTVVINCYGKIPQRGDIDFKNFTLVNTLFPRLLSRYIQQYNTSGGRSHFIHITTDCVFSGSKCGGGYTENDPSDVTDIYGVSKFLGETQQDTIIRTSIVGEALTGCGLLEWVKSNKNGEITGYTNHMWNGITCLELSKIIYQVVNQGLFWTGVKHFYSRGGGISKYQLVEYINNIWNLNIKINPVICDVGVVDKTLKSIRESGGITSESVDIRTQLIDLKKYNIS